MHAKSSVPSADGKANDADALDETIVFHPATSGLAAEVIVRSDHFEAALLRFLSKSGGTYENQELGDGIFYVVRTHEMQASDGTWFQRFRLRPVP